MACANCDRYVRQTEAVCPFCRVALPDASPLESSAGSRGSAPAGFSRAAAFAMRAALVAAAPGACGGEGTTPREASQDVAAAGAGASGGSSGAPASATGSSAAGESGGPVGIVLNDEGVADAGADAEPYAPIPIYGGVFPDPMSRARV